MNELAEGCFRLLIDMVLMAAWAAIRSGTWFALPFILFFIAICGYMLNTNVAFLQSQRAIDLSADTLSLMLTVPDINQTYHIAGSEVINLGSRSAANYGLLHVGFRYLFVASSTAIDEKRLEYVGKFVVVDSETVNLLLEDFPVQKDLLLPMYFGNGIGSAVDTPSLVIGFIIEVLIFALTGYTIWRFVNVTLLKRE